MFPEASERGHTVASLPTGLHPGAWAWAEPRGTWSGSLGSPALHSGPPSVLWFPDFRPRPW